MSWKQVAPIVYFFLNEVVRSPEFNPHAHILVILQMPSLSCGAWMAGMGKVGYAQCSNSKFKTLFGTLPGFLG